MIIRGDLSWSSVVESPRLMARLTNSKSPLIPNDENISTDWQYLSLVNSILITYFMLNFYLRRLPATKTYDSV